jgi:phage FluMu protein Com
MVQCGVCGAILKGVSRPEQAPDKCPHCGTGVNEVDKMKEEFKTPRIFRSKVTEFLEN